MAFEFMRYGGHHHPGVTGARVDGIDAVWACFANFEGKILDRARALVDGQGQASDHTARSSGCRIVQRSQLRAAA